MLVQDQDGKWYDDAGGTGSYHYETQDAASKAMGGGGGGGGAMPAMAGGFLWIFIIGPIIAAKIVGFLWGLLLKLGFVGKIITTALMVVAGPFIVTLPVFMAQGLFKGMTSVQFGIVYIGSALLLPVWYFFWHYDAVKEMGASVFSSKIKNFAIFLWIGLLLSIIIAAVKDSPELQGVIAIIASIAGFAYYFWSTRSYGKDAERDRTFKFRWIGIAAALGLTVVYGIAAKVEVAAEKANNAIEQAGGVSAKPAKNKKQREIAAKYTAGKIIVLDGPSAVNNGLYETASTYSTVLRKLKEGDRITLTGEVLFDPDYKNLGYAQVEFDGVTGWFGNVNLEYLTEFIE